MAGEVTVEIFVQNDLPTIHNKREKVLFSVLKSDTSSVENVGADTSDSVENITQVETKKTSIQESDSKKDTILCESSDGEESDTDLTSDQSNDGKQSKAVKVSKPSSRRRSSSLEGIHKCTVEGCNLKFSKPSRLKQHMRIHTGERPYECPAEGCSKSYTRQQHLKRHLETSHLDEVPQEQMKCDECGKIFSNKYSLRKHHYRYHVKEGFTCADCGQIFKKQQHLKTHTFLHTGIKPYVCEYPGCETRCENPSRLKRHSFIHKKSRYACPVEECQEAFELYSELRLHQSSRHLKVCDICGKQFKQLRKLKMHLNTHEDVREAYFCPLANCDKYFYHEPNLITHMKEKHEKSKIYQCATCNKCLSSKQKLTNHMAVHAPNYKRTYNPKKPRKPRKDKGVSRTDYACLLSGYYPDEELEMDAGKGPGCSTDMKCEDSSEEQHRNLRTEEEIEEMELQFQEF